MRQKKFPIQFGCRVRDFIEGLVFAPFECICGGGKEDVRVQMGWPFRSHFPKSAVASTEKTNKQPLSRGAHGFGGRWLVNGSGREILTINMTPTQRANVFGFPVRLRQLRVSVADPEALAKAIIG
jgi:hypothetical protein